MCYSKAMRSDVSPIKQLFATGQQLHYLKGQLIIHAEDMPDYVYCIKRGLVKIYSINNQGEEYVHIFYGPGEIFPMRWILGVGASWSNIFFQAATATDLYRLPTEQVLAVLQEDALLTTSLLRQVTRQFQLYADRIDNLEYKYASERLAYRLLLLAGRFGEATPAGTLLPPITQQDIANSVNLSRESANRELERLTRRGLIGRQGRRLIVRDHEALAKELHSDARPDGRKPPTSQQ